MQDGVYHHSTSSAASEYLVKSINQPHESVAEYGVFANGTRTLGTPLMKVAHPVVIALDTIRLSDTCYECHAQPGSLLDTQTESGKNSHTLYQCTGCKVARFCGSSCQRESWSSIHKLECRIFARLWPRVLPTALRAAMRVLLLKRSKSKEHADLAKETWEQLDSCPSHIDKFSARNDTTLFDLRLSTKPLVEYSKTNEHPDNILELLCRLKINAVTLMNEWFEPIGVVLQPLIAKINHSCSPNAFIQSLSATEIVVMPLCKIKDGEQITISYIEENKSLKYRQEELEERYFFTCKCERCKAETSQPSGPKTEQTTTTTNLEPRLTKQYLTANEPNDPTSRTQALKSLLKTLSTISPPWPKQQHPYPQTLQSLITASIDAQNFNHATSYAALQHLDLDPLVYNNQPHPTRLIHDLTFVRLLSLNEPRDPSSGSGSRPRTPDIRSYGIDLRWWRARVARDLYRRAKSTLVNDGTLFRDMVEPYEGLDGGMESELDDEIKAVAYTQRMRMFLDAVHAGIKDGTG